MNGPDRRTPLDAEELALARVLRALPAGDPPSSLDARILSMARDAVVDAPDQPDEASPHGRGPWGGRLALAASLLVAAGLVWRLGGLDPSAPDGASGIAPVPNAQEAPIAEALRAERSETPVVAETPPPTTTAPTRRVTAPPPPPAAAPPPPHAAVSFAAPMADAVPTENAAPAEASAERSASAPDTDTEEWIARIRDAWAAGDIDRARRDLRDFVDAHPDHPLPEDLAAIREGP